jgi:hypothetical protein
MEESMRDNRKRYNKMTSDKTSEIVRKLQAMADLQAQEKEKPAGPLTILLIVYVGGESRELINASNYPYYPYYPCKIENDVFPPGGDAIWFMAKGL